MSKKVEEKFWDTPPLIKIYEALGVIADDRIKIDENGIGKVFSSSKNKFYTVIRLIRSNMMKYFYLGYLIFIGRISIKNIKTITKESSKIFM